MGPRILVIDDSATTVELLTHGLGEAGYQAAAATDLASLDARLAEAHYDLVLVDVNMPEMYGDDVVEFLRVQRKLDAKLVLYSDLSEAELATKARDSGAHGFASKSRGLEGAIAEIARLLTAPPARKRRVLVVDDSEMTTELLRAELQAKGFEVSTADTADKATKIILKKQTRPDLVLLDVRMPNVNGEQFCRFIKSNSLFAGIKVLLCSSENVEELQRICRDAGADGYGAKDAVLAKVLGKLLP
ncbi:MAG: response regulator [Myxococcaceae bacterium]